MSSCTFAAGAKPGASLDSPTNGALDVAIARTSALISPYGGSLVDLVAASESLAAKPRARSQALSHDQPEARESGNRLHSFDCDLPGRGVEFALFVHTLLLADVGTRDGDGVPSGGFDRRRSRSAVETSSKSGREMSLPDA